MATLIHLNGTSGVGKSTIAQRYVAAHPGVLNCDIDRLRCLIGGWQEDFDGVGALVRPVAMAMIVAHLDGGHDVVLPQLLADADERARFRAMAVDAGHRYVQLLLRAPYGIARERFYARRGDDPLHAVIRNVVDRNGGAPAIDDLDRRLADATGFDDAIRIDAGSGVDATYRAVLGALGKPA